MIIDGNEIEKAAMKEFHKGNRKEGLRIQKNLPRHFGKNTKTKTIAPVKKPVVTTATVKNAWLSTGPTRNTCQTVCGRC